MKYLSIVMFVFCLHVSMATINAVGIVTGTQMQPSESWFVSVESEAKSNQYFQSSAVQEESSNFGFGDFVKGLAIFVGIFGFGIVVVPYTLTIFGLPLSLAIPLSLPIYVLYGLAWAQFTANRATKSMD